MQLRTFSGLPLETFLDRIVCGGGYYLGTLTCKPPEGYSLERLLFFLCGIEPLLELFFCPQHFQGDYSAWVKYQLASFRPEKLALPGPEAAHYFKNNVAFEPLLDGFFTGRTEDVEISSYVLAGFYRQELARQRTREGPAYSKQTGKDLLDGLSTHAFKMAPDAAYNLWGRAIKVAGRPGEELRRAFLTGGYHWFFSDADFVAFISSEETYKGASGPDKKLIYAALEARRYLFEGNDNARALMKILAGPLEAWSKDYITLSRQKSDILSVLHAVEPDQLRKIMDAINAQLGMADRSLFYIADFGPAKEADFKGFDAKLDAIVEIINKKYRTAETLPDLWQDPHFKFLYLMSALWFKHCTSSGI